MCRLLDFARRCASAGSARGDDARIAEGYRDALLSGWVSPPDVSAGISAGVAAPAPAPAQAEPPDDAVLERFYRNQG
jgi:hypothetical protein